MQKAAAACSLVEAEDSRSNFCSCMQTELNLVSLETFTGVAFANVGRQNNCQSLPSVPCEFHVNREKRDRGIGLLCCQENLTCAEHT